MRDGRVDVYDSGYGVQNTVTIDTDRHQCDNEMSHIKFRMGMQGALFKGLLLLGVVRRQQGNALSHPQMTIPLGERNSIF